VTAPVPDGDGELTVELIEAGGAALLVEVQHRLRVRLGDQAVAAPSQPLAQLHVVEHLAVHDDPERAVLVSDGLLAGLQVDDAEPRRTEADLLIQKQAELVWPAVADRGQHLAQEALIGRLAPAPI